MVQPVLIRRAGGHGSVRTNPGQRLRVRVLWMSGMVQQVSPRGRLRMRAEGENIVKRAFVVSVRSWRLFGELVIGTAAACAIALLLLPRVAVADPVLNGMIMANPVPGWRRASPQAVQALSARLRAELSNDTRGQTVDVAAQVWEPPTGASQLLDITLEQWPSDRSNLDQIMSTTLDNECLTVTGDDPSSIGSAANLGGALSSLCKSAVTNSQLAIVIARKGDYMEVVESIGINGDPALSPASVDQIASSQYVTLPGVPSDVGEIVIGVLSFLGVAGAAIAVVEARKRRSTGWHAGLPVQRQDPWAGAGMHAGAGGTVMAGGMPLASSSATATAPDFYIAGGVLDRGDSHGDSSSPSAPGDAASAPDFYIAGGVRHDSQPAGWYPENGNPRAQRYWDGRAWTQRAEWNGVEWAPAPLTPG